MAVKTRLHIQPPRSNGPMVASIEVGADGPLAFLFGSGRHPDEAVHIAIPGSEGKIRSRVGAIVIEPDGLGVGRTPEAMDHQLTIRHADHMIPEVLSASPTRVSTPPRLIERKFLEEHLVIQIDFPPHRFEFEVVVTKAPWASRVRSQPVRPYKMIIDEQVRLLVLAIVEPTLQGDEPRSRTEELVAALGWSPRTLSSVGARAHLYFFGDPAHGDRSRIVRLASHVATAGFVTSTDIQRELYPYQEAKGL